MQPLSVKCYLHLPLLLRLIGCCPKIEGRQCYQEYSIILHFYVNFILTLISILHSSWQFQRESTAWGGGLCLFSSWALFPFLHSETLRADFTQALHGLQSPSFLSSGLCIPQPVLPGVAWMSTQWLGGTQMERARKEAQGRPFTWRNNVLMTVSADQYLLNTALDGSWKGTKSYHC